MENPSLKDNPKNRKAKLKMINVFEMEINAPLNMLLMHFFSRLEIFVKRKKNVNPFEMMTEWEIIDSICVQFDKRV